MNLVKEALRRGVILEGASDHPASERVQAAAMVELANAGFFTKLEELSTLSEEELTELIEVARSLMAADRDMTPIYPGFPKQVQELDTLTLLVEQLLHYWSTGVLLPDHPAELRPGLPISEVLKDHRGVAPLKMVTYNELLSEVLSEVANTRVSVGEAEKNLLSALAEADPESFINACGDFNKVANDENRQRLGEAALQAGVSPEEVFEVFGRGSLSSLLRVFLSSYGRPAKKGEQEAFVRAVEHLSDVDAWSVAFKKVPRASRRLLVRRLGRYSSGYLADQLVSKRELWQRVVRSIHGFEFVRSANEKRALDIISENVAYHTFNSLVEQAFEEKDIEQAVALLSLQPGNFLRRLVALLRLVKSDAQAVALSTELMKISEVSLNTLVSAYNGVLSANDEHARVTRVAGRLNTMLEREVELVDEEHLVLVLSALRQVFKKVLAKVGAPESPVGVLDDDPVVLVRRDLSLSDKQVERGERFELADGPVLRFFGHWVNNMPGAGYMDTGVVVLSAEAEVLGFCDWASWDKVRSWATYSGDKLVYPGDSAAEFIDVEVAKLREKFSNARYLAMTVQSWSGFKMVEVDFMAGVMVREEANSGEVFEARTVATAFKPTTESLQAVPLVVDLETREMIWLDSSNGSTRTGVSLASDNTISSIVYDELLRKRLSFGELAALWAEAHGVETVESKAPREELLKLL